MPRLPLQNRLHRILHTLLQSPVLNPQHLSGPRIVKPIHIRREIILSPLQRRQLPNQLRVPVHNDIRKPLIREMPSNNIKPLAPSLRPHNGPHMCQRHVANVDPRKDRRGGLEAVAHPAEDEVADALVGGVDGVQRRELPLDGAEGVCVADGGEVEIGLLVGDECPGGLFGEFLCD